MFPAQALAEIFKGDHEVALFTDARGLKHTKAFPADPIEEISAATISLRNLIKLPFNLIKLANGIGQARSFIRSWQPDVAVGFGGYPAFPVMRAANALKLPYYLHEQNAVLGRVNRVFAKDARAVASGFEDLERLPEGANHVCTGNPLREQIIKAIPKTYTAPKRIIHVLIVGGSLGARIISETIPEAIAALPEDLRKRLRVVQQTREESLDHARKTYAAANVNAVCEPFFSDIETHLAKAHYVIGRAGASSVAEVAAMGKPSLFVPLAIAMDNHQMGNAKTLARLDAADILTESEFSVQSVESLLEARLNDSNWLENAAAAARSAAKPDAAQRLAELVTASF